MGKTPKLTFLWPLSDNYSSTVVHYLNFNRIGEVKWTSHRVTTAPCGEVAASLLVRNSMICRSTNPKKVRYSARIAFAFLNQTSVCSAGSARSKYAERKAELSAHQSPGYGSTETSFHPDQKAAFMSPGSARRDTLQQNRSPTPQGPGRPPNGLSLVYGGEGFVPASLTDFYKIMFINC